MTTFHVVLQRSGPQWDAARPIEEQTAWLDHASFMDGLVESGFVIMGGPLADEHRVVLVVDADSQDAVRATLERDPWHETHLVIDSIDPWWCSTRRTATDVATAAQTGGASRVTD